MLTNPGPPEGILVYGPPGAGKTTAWLSIARLSEASGSPAKFYVITTDNTLPRMTAKAPLSNLVLYPCLEWLEFEDALDDIMEKAGPGDWLVVDLADNAWSRVQDYFTESVFGKDMATFLMDARRVAFDSDKKGLKTFEQLLDWRPINALYRRWAQRAFLGLPMKKQVNVFLAVRGVPLGENEDQGLREMFGPSGLRPAGQKELAWDVHTVLLMKERDRLIITIKDRERVKHAGTKVKSFAQDYLLGTAGWTL